MVALVRPRVVILARSIVRFEYIAGSLVITDAAEASVVARRLLIERGERACGVLNMVKLFRG